VSSAAAYDGLTRFLVDSDPVKGAHGEWVVRRVGRKPVWRIQSRSGTFFVKVMKDSRYYRRERHGLEISQQLAAQHEWMTAPELVHLNEARRVLITTALPGMGVGRLLRSAFRMDRNPFRRKAPMEEFLRTLSIALQWLAELHQMPVTCNDLLLDHSATRVRERILGKLTRALEHGVLEVDEQALERFRQLDVSVPEPASHLICGDATLGNFLWDAQRQRIGRVDFEDFGFGAPSRDFSEIRQGLEDADRKSWYWNVDQAMQVVPSSSLDVEEGLHRLEWALDRHWPGGRRRPPRRRRPTRRMRALNRRIQNLLAAITR
jgi:aminoglycoside phosphotransferase (APT) family kinase protein